jgi:hypothetical protein
MGLVTRRLLARAGLLFALLGVGAAAAHAACLDGHCAGEACASCALCQAIPVPAVAPVAFIPPAIRCAFPPVAALPAVFAAERAAASRGPPA